MADLNLFRTPTTAASIRAKERELRQIESRLENPLANTDEADLLARGEAYARKHGITDAEDVRAFRIGAVLAKGKMDLDTRVSGGVELDLTDDEVAGLRLEATSRWKGQSKQMLLVVVFAALCAAVQGMDETVVNGAQIFYNKTFGIENRSWIIGLVNGAPYLSCTATCWLTPFLNRHLGLRGTISLTCFVSFATCIGQSFATNWQTMFIARFLLGLGIGPKSASVPIYSAETAPAHLRGAMVMMWQMFTAFGIMLGYIAGLAFFQLANKNHAWRLMMGSAGIPAFPVMVLIWSCPESPRWMMSKCRHFEAYKSFTRLRTGKILAARDCFYAAEQIRIESELAQRTQGRVLQIFTVPRNRRAMYASQICMFMQQFCGVNVIAYYSSQIFLQGGFGEQQALAASLGFGIVNFLFALPAVYTIDTFGRRSLLLATFPVMSIFLFFTGASFNIGSEESSTARIACIAIGIYLFGMVYSPGEGPVPFTYSAEAYPLSVRSEGMSLATATCWGFNFLLSITWPVLQKRFTTQGAFYYYATWNIVGFFLALLFVRETKSKTLEELDAVFEASTPVYMRYGIRQLRWFFSFAFGGKSCDKPEEPMVVRKLDIEDGDEKETVSQPPNDEMADS